MPKFIDHDDLQTHPLGGSNYAFSATRVDDLGATEYTLVTLAVDVSGSVAGYAPALEQCVKQVVRSCMHSPRADNLLLRLVTFSSSLNEVHGFRPLSECDEARYTGCIRTGGATILFDAALNAVNAIAAYGKDLTANDMDVNGIVILITDGEDAGSTLTANEVRRALADAMQTESLESIRTILVGVVGDETSPSRSEADRARAINGYLKDLVTGVGIDQYVPLNRADASTLARLAEFVSKSISAQSQSLGTGGPSQSLTF
ncbi:MAG: hypothetical protein EXR71_19200 [Myxococcales bacterium]|nr:hypothetical protein [Myxococcales bacterium]